MKKGRSKPLSLACSLILACLSFLLLGFGQDEPPVPLPGLNLPTGNTLGALKRVPSEFHHSCFRHDGKVAALCSQFVRFYDVDEHRAGPAVNVDGGKPIHAVFTPDGQRLVVLYEPWRPGSARRSPTNHIAVLSVPTGEELNRFEVHLEYGYDFIQRIFVSPDSNKVATGSPKEIVVFDLNTGKLIWNREVPGIEAPGYQGANKLYISTGLDVLPDWSRFLQGMRVFPYPEGESTGPISIPAGDAKQARGFNDNLFTPDGKHIVALGGQGRWQRLINVEGKWVVRDRTDKYGTGNSITMHPKGTFVATQRGLWNLAGGSFDEIRLSSGGSDEINFHPKGDLILSADGWTDLSKPAEERKVVPFGSAEIGYYNMGRHYGHNAISDEGHLILRTGMEFPIRQTTIDPKATSAGTIDAPTLDYHMARPSRQGRRAQSAFKRVQVRGANIYTRPKDYDSEAGTGVRAHKFNEEGYPEILPDLRVVLVTATNVMVVNALDGDVQTSIKTASQMPDGSSIDASEDGRRVAAFSNRRMRLFDLEAGKEATKKPIYLAGIQRRSDDRAPAQFNPTGTHLSYRKGSEIYIRSMDADWKVTDRFLVPHENIVNMGLSPNGKHLLVMTGDWLFHLYEKTADEWTLRASVLSNNTGRYTVFDAKGDQVFSNHKNPDDIFHR